MGKLSGLTSAAFNTGNALDKLNDLNFYGADGNISNATVNCANSMRNRKCFPEMVWDNLQSTSIVKALPIVDDIGAILGVFMKNKGSGVNLESKSSCSMLLVMNLKVVVQPLDLT